ncbi:MAG TPA: ABC transporter permease [Vicinamibacterales bacterium]|nr:ABC transporter permease [Vicinamibacterales bacterium]
MLHDLKHACRMLSHTRGWTLVVLLSLAIGIGATTALFTAVNGLLLQTIPVREPGELVILKWAGQNDMVRSSSDYGFSAPINGQRVRSTFSYATYLQLKAANQTMTDVIGGTSLESFNFASDGSAEIATSFGVTGNYFKTLGVPAAIGRAIEESDDRPDAESVAVLSHAFWMKRFGGNPSVVGRTVRLNNIPVTIVGVLPPSYIGIQRMAETPRDVTIPLVMESRFVNVVNIFAPAGTPPPKPRLNEPTNWYIQIAGRLKPGMTREQVRGNLGGPFQQAARAGMAEYKAGLTDAQRKLSSNQRDGSAVPELVVLPGERGIYDLDTTSSRSASILSVIVVLLLLIVCANVANLLLSRAAARHKEVSVRLSMGASRKRLVRQLLTESLLLSGTGGVLGIALGYWSKKLLPFGQNTQIDFQVLAFVAGISVLTGLIFGLVPALRATNVDLAGAMKESGRSVSVSRTWLSKALLVTQVAVSVVLLIGAGLFVRTLQNLRSVDIGFESSNILMFRINPALNRYTPERTQQLYDRVQDALSALPGVRAVSYTRTALLSGSTSSTSIFRQGATTQKDGKEIHIMSVSPGFFETMRIPVLRGRDFDARDVQNPTASVLINETAASKYFPNEDPIGQRVGQSPEESGQSEIVGIIRDTKYDSVRDPVPPTIYTSIRPGTRTLTVLVRTAGEPSAMTETVRQTLQQIDADVPMTGITTQSAQVEGRFAQERLFALAYSLFGALALLLACIGLFGLMSYSVSRRTNEIGIRMALGAQRAGMVGMVLRESMLMVAIGVAIGLAAAVAGGRFIESVLFGLQTTDTLTISAALGATILVSLAAGYLPARRASRVDPMVALRYE